MSHLQYFDYPGYGERARKELHYSQAVRVGNTIDISGQGGWDRVTEKTPDDLGAEVDQAFDNVEHTLQQAGGKGWEQVYKIRLYVVPYDDEVIGHVLRNLKRYCPNHQPVVTGVGVQKLAYNMRIEMEVLAHVED